MFRFKKEWRGVFFNTCEKKHKIRSSAKEITIGEPNKKPPCLYSQDEIRKLVATKNLRNRAMFFLALQAGLRKGELGSRKWKDIDFERNSVWIREDGFTPKDRAVRFIPLKHETKEALLELRNSSKYNKSEDLIFPNSKGKEFLATKPFPRSNFDRPMKEALKSIGR